MGTRVINVILGLSLWCIGLLTVVHAQTDSPDYHAQYRLQFHFSPPTGFGNDPNGLLYGNGIYEFYYQQTEDTLRLGPINWAHAQTSDLIHWKNLPLGITPDADQGEHSVFSGSAIFDPRNLTGVASDNDSSGPPMIAFYTASSDSNVQSQSIAYSLDRGVSFTQYGGNPDIPNPGIANFRDPFLFTRDDSDKYFMVMTASDRLQFYTSTDLLNWEYAGDFGVNPEQGDKSAPWETPSLVTLKDEEGNKHDVILLSVNNNDTLYGQTEYFIGQFNGTTLNSYDPSRILIADYGYDCYAGVPYLTDPKGRIIMMSWMSHWIYAGKTPTDGWRGQYSFPHELSLQTVDGLLYIVQRPIEELDTLIDSSRTYTLDSPVELSGQDSYSLELPFKTNSLLKLEYTLDIQNAVSGEIVLKIGNDEGEFVTFTYFVDKDVYELNRDNSGDTSFEPAFTATVAQAPRISRSKLLTGLILLDNGSIEIFADGGLTTFNAIFFPSQPYENIDFNIDLGDLSESMTLQDCSVDALNSIWE